MTRHELRDEVSKFRRYRAEGSLRILTREDDTPEKYISERNLRRYAPPSPDMQTFDYTGDASSLN